MNGYTLLGVCLTEYPWLGTVKEVGQVNIGLNIPLVSALNIYTVPDAIGI